MTTGMSAKEDCQRPTEFEETGKPPQRPTAGRASPSSNSGRSSSATATTSDRYGCAHYRRACSLFAPCCKKFFVCRICHNEEQEHELDRRKVETIQCMACSKSQPVSNQCEKCGIVFAKYFCEKCRLFAGEDSGPIFHCEECGICRKGTKETVQHCAQCGSCVQKNTLDKHRCRPYALHDSCPICRMDMFDSRELVVYLPCAHAMHEACFKECMKHDYRCPTCLKTVTNPKEYFSTIRQYTQKYVPEPHNAGRTVTIFCNDCEQRDVAKYHPMYWECPKCKGYNTVEVKSNP